MRIQILLLLFAIHLAFIESACTQGTDGVVWPELEQAKQSINEETKRRNDELLAPAVAAQQNATRPIGVPRGNRHSTWVEEIGLTLVFIVAIFVLPIAAMFLFYLVKAFVSPERQDDE